jgi:hypothetical protein
MIEKSNAVCKRHRYLQLEYLFNSFSAGMSSMLIFCPLSTKSFIIWQDGPPACFLTALDLASINPSWRYSIPLHFALSAFPIAWNIL